MSAGISQEGRTGHIPRLVLRKDNGSAWSTRAMSWLNLLSVMPLSVVAKKYRGALRPVG